MSKCPPKRRTTKSNKLQSPLNPSKGNEKNNRKGITHTVIIMNECFIVFFLMMKKS
tara:strand:- start:4371 stop:4538 length:168 start_codon:yes stop_codon:yes gene_type:complete